MTRRNPKRSLARKTILHILTGSVASAKGVDVIQALRDEGARVVCVLTESAKHFITPLVARAVSGERVYHDFFSPETPYDVLHTSLAEEAHLVLIAPASADFIARLAAGMADDLASCIVLATKRPVVIAPAMNDQMLNHPMTRGNIQKLKGIGYKFVDPIHGYLVCGKEALGHIADPETIVKQVGAALGARK